MNPMPKVVLHSLFQSARSGPNKLVQFVGKGGQKRFDELCNTQHSELQSEVAKLKKGPSETEEAKNRLQELEQSKNTASLEKARVKAAETFAAKRMGRNITLKYCQQKKDD